MVLREGVSGRVGVARFFKFPEKASGN